MADNQASQGWCQDHVHVLSGNPPDLGSKLAAQELSVLRMCQDKGALQVFRTMQSAGQAKMPFQIRAGLIKEIENLFRGCSH